MPPEKSSSFINVDALLPDISLETAARYYGVPLPELHRTGAETPRRCFLNCGRTCETGDRVLAILAETAAKTWHCHHYGCGKGGNLVSLCDLMKPGATNGGRPRGPRFKEIAADLKAMAVGESGPSAPAAAAPAAPRPEPSKVNVPLRESPNERARGLTELDRKFVRDVALMPPRASAYLRRRPFLSPEVLAAWRVGYLPRDACGEDKSGGTMRGKIVYPYLSETGDVLTWFGRDPEYEDKHKGWEATDKSEREPEKFHFVKGFHRGIELFGQHALKVPGTAERLQGLGLPLVEGPNDVIRMATLGVPAVGLCSNLITREQAMKVASLAREVGGGIATIFLDCDAEGENGMKQALGYLAQLLPVRLAWTSKLYGGTFKGRQPESLTLEEWNRIAQYLRAGTAADQPQ